MRTLVLAVILAACGSSTPAAPRTPPVVAAHDAARWVPPGPTYALVARRVRDVQRALVDAADVLGLLLDKDPRDLAMLLRDELGFDPFSTDDLAAAGIDLDGGLAIFSESLEPTLVVHLAAPDQVRAELDERRARAGSTSSRIVDGIEIFGARLSPGVTVSWAIDGDWLWLHLGWERTARDDASWFSGRRRPATWRPARAAGVVASIDPRALLRRLAPRIADVAACAGLVAPVERVDLAFDGDGRSARVELGLSLAAPAAASLERAILPAPAGWHAEAARAPLAVQWNVDLPVALAWFGPCARALDAEHTPQDLRGIRALRLLLHTVEPAAKRGTGAASVELTSSQEIARLLDQIPMRAHLESKIQVGPHAARRLAIPFGPTIDYVLTDRLALLAVGDDLLARVVGTGGTSPSPVFALDVRPAAFTVETWAYLLDLADVPNAPAVAQRLTAWKRGRLAIYLAPSGSPRLVVEATGERL